MTAVKSQAQTTDAGKWRLGFGVEGGIPTGDIKGYSNYELGGTARLQYRASRNLYLTFTSGYYNFFAKNVTITGTNFVAKPDDMGIIPVKAGVKTFLGQHFYLAGEAGAGFETPGGPVKLILSPGFGYATRSWEAGVRYENFWTNNSNFGTVALRIAYGFDL
ncbi:MAG TPA: hypothetical protein VJ844_04385 [Mucilaginibacter sp.]|nr:hypothetical protein [Mucilaginibacter sp.]